MKRFRPTKVTKILIMVLLVALIGGGVFAGIKTGFVKTSSDKKTENNQTTDNNDSNNDKQSNNSSSESSSADNIITEPSGGDNEINISLDEWIGYASIIQANGGLTTQKGSIYDQLGIKVNISVINDAAQSSNALIKGILDGAGYTVNRFAFLSKKFSDAGVDVIFPYITNYSNGGDGIIANSSIKTAQDLVGKKIGVPQLSESQTMLVWFVNQSNLSDSEKKDIIDNLIFFETADETAKAFFAGKIDVAGTWQPYLTQAENMTDSHILFSTADATKLILSGMTFRKDFAEANPELVSKFIDGTLQAIDNYDKELDVLRESMPMFNGMSDEDIIGMTQDAALCTWKNNIDLLDGDAKTVYSNMCSVWTSIGESVNADIVDTAFDSTYMEMLRDKYEEDERVNTVEQKEVVVTEDIKANIEEMEALLSNSGYVTFVKNTAKFDDPAAASAALDEFIQTAKILDGSIIRVVGNTDPNPNTDPEDKANLALSIQRAETVRQYLIMNGIPAERIIADGVGSSNPIVENDTEEHRAMNRRTDFEFYTFE